MKLILFNSNEINSYQVGNILNELIVSKKLGAN